MQWHAWFEQHKFAIASPDKVTMRAPDDYGFGYGIFVDGKRVLGRNKAERITAESIAADVATVTESIRIHCGHTHKKAIGNDDPNKDDLFRCEACGGLVRDRPRP